MVIYADVIFSVNFISTFALLIVYTLLRDCGKKYLRLTCAALLSGVYAVAEAMLNLPYILRLTVLVCVIVIAFGKSSLIYNTTRFIFISVCIEIIFILIMSLTGNDGYIAGGSVTVFTGDIWGVVIYTLSYPVLIISKRLLTNRTRTRIAELVINSKKLRLLLLYDSGNLLVHKGVTVGIVAWESIKTVFGYSSYEELMLSDCDKMIFNTVGAGGVLPILEVEHAIIDGVERKIRIAVINRSFNSCDGIIGI